MDLTLINRPPELSQAHEWMDAGQYQDVVNLLLGYLKQSPQDHEAQFLLARAYSALQDFTNSFLWCKKAADEGGVPGAQALLALHYCEGVGVKKSGPDALRYIKLASVSKDADVWNSINLCKGMMYWMGLGVERNIPEAYRHFRLAQGFDIAREYIKLIEESYPMTDEGEIDLKQRKRSKWATFFLWITLLSTLMTWVPMVLLNVVDSSPGMASPGGSFTGGFSWLGVVTGAVLVLLPIFVLFWKRWAFWGMVGVFFLVLVLLPLFVVPAVGDSATLSSEQASYVMALLNLGLYPLIFLTLLIRRRGYCQPLCALTGLRDTGVNPVRRLFGRILCYGEGDAYILGARRTKLFSIYHYVGLGLMVLLAAWGAWGVAQNRFDLGVEWNIFKSSGLWFFLSVIGFFLQFFNWQHTSFDHVTEVTYTDGSKKRYKSRDLMDVMEGQFLWPFIAHLFLIPAVYGAMMYYVIMIGLAVLGGVMPYVLAALVLASVYVYYKGGVWMKQRKYRIGLLVTMSLAFGMTYLLLSGDASLPSLNIGSGYAQSSDPRFVRCTASAVNLRERPDANSARLYMEASDSGRREFLVEDTNFFGDPRQLNDGEIVQVVAEEGDWYELLVDGVHVYAMKQFFVPIYPANIELGLKGNEGMKDLLVYYNSGKYKKQWIYNDYNEMDELQTFYGGKSHGKGILFTKRAYLWWNNELVKDNPASPSGKMYENCPLLLRNQYSYILDIRNAPEDFLDKIFAEAEACEVTLYYFVETDRFVWTYNE